MEHARTPLRRLRIFLRDFRMLEATVHLGEGQALATYFASRRSYVNLRAARWKDSNHDVNHAVLKVEQVLWAAALDGDIPLTNASAVGRERPVEMQVDGGLLIRGRLILGEQQRLSDYLETAGDFLPMVHAQLLRSGRPSKSVNVELGDVVLNQEAIQAIWEVDKRFLNEED